MDDTMTVIGGSVKVRGKLTGDEDLHVLGRIEGSIDLRRTLIVAESGIVKAEVSVRNAIISGVVVGNISASESVEITQQGRMVGDINAPRVIIVDGASFKGSVDMGDVKDMPVRSERPRPRRIATPETSSETVVEKSEAPPTKKTVVAAAKPAAKEIKKPSFLEPPKSKKMPTKKAGKKRVVVKRR